MALLARLYLIKGGSGPFALEGTMATGNMPLHSIRSPLKFLFRLLGSEPPVKVRGAGVRSLAVPVG